MNSHHFSSGQNLILSSTKRSLTFQLPKMIDETKNHQQLAMYRYNKAMKPLTWIDLGHILTLENNFRIL